MDAHAVGTVRPRDPEREGLYRQARRAAWIGLAINLCLGATKLVGGILGDSFALISDAVNSLGDVVTNAVVIYAFKVAQWPPDAEHPYGHTRAEAVAGSNVALAIIATALFVVWEAAWRLTAVHDLPPSWTLWIAGTNIVIKEVLYRYKFRVGRRTGSIALIANAWDHRSDALCSLAVLVGLSLVRWGGAGLMFMDEVAALVVATAILFTGVSLFRRSASELLDEQARKDVVDEVRATALSTAGVRGVEKLWVRKSGLEYLVDIHIEVDPSLTVAEGHGIGHRVKDALLARFPVVRDVLVHLEPHGG